MNLRSFSATNRLINGELVVGRVIGDLAFDSIQFAGSGLVYRSEFSALFINLFAHANVYGEDK